MARRIKPKTIRNWAIGSGSAGIMLVVAISMLISQGVVEVGSYEANEICGGDIPCELILRDACFNQDVFFYPMKAHEIINASPSDVINEMNVYRGWGSGWREIDFNDTCQSTWCGAKPDTTTNKFSWAARKDKCYDLKFEIYKPENSTIEWNINPSGVFFGKDDLVVLESNTDECYHNCHTDYMLINPTNSTINDIFNVSFLNEQGLKDFSVQYRVFGNVTEQKANVTWYNETTANGTVQRQNITYYNETVEKWYFTDYELDYEDKKANGTISLDSGDNITLRIAGSLNWEQWTDNIICFSNFCYPEYAEWNFSSYEVAYYNFANVSDQLNDYDLSNDGATSVSVFPTFNTTGNSSPNSFSFDGTNDKLNNNSLAPVLASQTEGTISVWFNTTDDGMLFAINDFSNDADFFYLYITASGYIQIDLGAAGDWRPQIETNYSDGSWHHFVFSSNSTHNFFYVDGIDVTSEVNWVEGNNDGTWFSDVANPSESDIFSIGVLDRATPLAYFDGQLDEFKFWNTSLNSTHISNLYNFGTINEPIDITFTGRVINSTSSAIANATVYMLDQTDNTLVVNLTTNSTGYFTTSQANGTYVFCAYKDETNVWGECAYNVTG